MNFGGGGHKCPKCGKSVYFAEEVTALGAHWHKTCFLCSNKECNKRLDKGSCTEHEDQAYCNPCHRRLFGPRGYGFGVGAGTLSMDHPDSSKPTEKVVTTAANTNGHNNKSPPVSDQAQRNTALRQANQQQILNRQISKGKMFGSGGEKCARCNKTVYLAERILAAGQSWHRNGCFTCSHCNKRLDTGTICERDNEIFCKNCYGRNYGPKGYGYGLGAGVLQSEVTEVAQE